MTINYTMLPEHMREGARRYVEHGIRGGSFMTAVFSNDFLEAFQRADDSNTAAMREWASFLHNEAPSGCHGSWGAVREWIDRGGLAGPEAAA